MNKVILMGNLTGDPVQRMTAANTAVTSFRVAVRRSFKDKQTGEYPSDFFSCISFGKTAEFIASRFAKGTKMILEGSLQTSSYEKDGSMRYVTEVVVSNVEFCESKAAAAGQASGLPDGFSVVDDDDLPF